MNAHTTRVCDHERLINAHREVVGLIASEPDFQQAAAQIAELVADTLGADGASVTQVVGGHYRYVAAVGSAERAAGTSRPLEGSFTGSVISDRATRLFRLDDVGAGSITRAKTDGIRSGVVAPVVLDNTVIGTVGIASARADQFSDRDATALGDFASFLALGFKLAEREQRLERRAEELETAQRKAEQSLVARMNFLGAVDHELRTPLTAILGYAQFAASILAETDGVDKEVPEIIGYIEESGHELLRTVEKIVGLSRATVNVETRRSSSVFQIFELLRDEYDQATASKGLTLEFSVGPLVPETVTMDSEIFMEAMRHVLDNAVKFTSAGGIRVTAEWKNSPESILTVSCSDTGVGMSEAIMAVAFDPLTQGDMSGTRQFGGLGNGLALVQKLCGQLGGTVSVSSNPACGSCFTLTLPVGVGN